MLFKVCLCLGVGVSPFNVVFCCLFVFCFYVYDDDDVVLFAIVIVVLLLLFWLAFYYKLRPGAEEKLIFILAN